MRLETEFRLCLQRRSLEWAFQHSPSAATDMSATALADLKQSIAPSIWVKLVQPPSEYSDDEALLLCQCTDQQWAGLGSQLR